MSKTQKTIFTLSIILNIMLLGMTGGMAYKKHHMPSWQSVATQELKPETRELVQRHFEKGREEIRPLLSSMMKEREQLVALMNQEQFDEAAFNAEVARIQKIQKQISDAKANSMKELMAEIPYEERVKLTGSFVRFFTWDRGGRHGGKSGHERPGPYERVP